jgi:hypothetical protein
MMEGRRKAWLSQTAKMPPVVATTSACMPSFISGCESLSAPLMAPRVVHSLQWAFAFVAHFDECATIHLLEIVEFEESRIQIPRMALA